MVHLSVTHKKFKTSKRLRDLNSLLTSKKAIKKQVLSKIFAFNVFQQRLLIFYVDAKVHRLFFYHFVWLFSLSLSCCVLISNLPVYITPRISIIFQLITYMLRMNNFFRSFTLTLPLSTSIQFCWKKCIKQ